MNIILGPEELASLTTENLRIVDLCAAEAYARNHIPGAFHLDYARLNRVQPPAQGLLPDLTYLEQLFADLGIGAETLVVAYDDEGGGKAARLCWTLEVCGHHQYALLDGGIHAWADQGQPLVKAIPTATPTHFKNRYSAHALADREEVLARLGDTGVILLDCRSAGEFSGREKRAARGGHIPGAVHMEWTEALDRERNLRLKPPETLLQRFENLGIGSGQEIVTYCQTHHRSSHTWLVLKHLGFARVRGYPGSWSEWGNLPELPIELSHHRDPPA